MPVISDVRHAIRSLAKAPAFTSTAVLTLAFGLALATTAMVVVDAYLFSNLPYPAADRLYNVRYAPPGQDPPREMESLDWRSLDDVIEAPVAWDLDVFYLLGGENAERMPGAWVTAGFVEGLGIRPATGRGFDASAFAAGDANVALISHRLWQSRFGGDPSIVGRRFMAYVSDRPDEAEGFTIIGVLPPDFWHFNTYTDILAPLRAPTYPYLVRLRAGVSADRAAARITALVSAGAGRVPPDWSAQLVPAHDQYVAGVRPLLRAVTVAAMLVLLVACGNVATLFLIRAARRRKEIAVRSALGAGRWTIARMLLAETAVLGIAASALALVITRMTVNVIAPMVQQQLGRNAPVALTAVAVDIRTLAAVFAAGIVAMMVCAVVPMMTAVRPALTTALQGSGRTATDSRGPQRLRAALIAFEIAASLALVAGSTLMIRSVVTLLRSDPGFSVERVINASVTLRQQKYPDAPARLALFERMAARLAAVPGVESVGMTTAWPLQEGRLQPLVLPDAGEGTRAAVQSVNDDYFATLGIPLVAGRRFTSADRMGTGPVALVSETLARRLWPAGTALGATLVVPEQRDGADEPIPVPRTVVGIVRDVRQVPADRDLADAYVPILQTPGRFTFALMRTSGAPETWVSAVRAAFRDIDPEIAVQQSRPLAAAMNEALARPRFMTWLLIAFAAIAGALALVGAYGVIAYAVRQREREIAVRLAIGADPARITRLFVRQGSWIVGAGLAAGLLAVLAGGRVIESELFGITPRDPLTLTAAVLAFGAAGLIAVWWPARRAAATDPAIALRAE